VPRNTRDRKRAAQNRNELYTKLAHKQQLWWAQAEPYTRAVMALGELKAATKEHIGYLIKNYRAMPLHKQWRERKTYLGFLDLLTSAQPDRFVGHFFAGHGKYVLTPPYDILKGDVRLSFGGIPS
jgi:hypothetical protein